MKQKIIEVDGCRYCFFIFWERDEMDNEYRQNWCPLRGGEAPIEMVTDEYGDEHPEITDKIPPDCPLKNHEIIIKIKEEK